MRIFYVDLSAKLEQWTSDSAVAVSDGVSWAYLVPSAVKQRARDLAACSAMPGRPSATRLLATLIYIAVRDELVGVDHVIIDRGLCRIAGRGDHQECVAAIDPQGDAHRACCPGAVCERQGTQSGRVGSARSCRQSAGDQGADVGGTGTLAGAIEKAGEGHAGHIITALRRATGYVWRCGHPTILSVYHNRSQCVEIGFGASTVWLLAPTPPQTARTAPCPPPPAPRPAVPRRRSRARSRRAQAAPCAARCAA